MQILFIDESGTPPQNHNFKDSPYFVLGGVIIPEEMWHKIKTDLETIKNKYNVTGEIKWRYFAPHHEKIKRHSLSHLAPMDKELLRIELFNVLNKYKSIKAICVITNAEEAYKLSYIKTPDDIYWYTYKQITERFQYYLQDISRISGQKINGIIVCDHRAPNDDRRLQELHAKLLLGYHNKNSKYNHLIEGVFIAPSHLSVGIQLSDMVAGAILRKYKANDTRFFEKIIKILRKSESGIIEGYGLVHFPNGKEILTKEVLRSLDLICLQELCDTGLDKKNQKDIYKLPDPSDLNKSYLERLNIKLPEAFINGMSVATKNLAATT